MNFTKLKNEIFFETEAFVWSNIINMSFKLLDVLLISYTASIL